MYVRTDRPRRGGLSRLVSGLGCACRNQRLGAVEDSPYYTDENTQTFIGPLLPSGDAVPAPSAYATPAELAALNVGAQAVPGLTRGGPSGNYSAGALTTADYLLGASSIAPSGLVSSGKLGLNLSSNTVLYGGIGLAVVIFMVSRRR
jgi:hypothetical protein